MFITFSGEFFSAITGQPESNKKFDYREAVISVRDDKNLLRKLGMNVHLFSILFSLFGCLIQLLLQ